MNSSQTAIKARAPIISQEVEIEPEVTEDPSYYELQKPIQVGQASVSKILLDPSGLSGPAYFKIVSRFRKEYPEEYSNSTFKFSSEIFLTLVLAELNPPMTPEDFAKISFVDLEFIFFRSKVLAFQKGTAKKIAA
jgi:hypothetical protein